MSKRKALGSRVRFEVFKRDDFTCRYCGNKSPNVVLELDHVVAVAAGGSDDPMNLVTSCYACNRGKSDRPLGQVLSGDDPHDRAIELAERARELTEYETLRTRFEVKLEKDVEWLAKTFTLPNDLWKAVRSALREFSAWDIADALNLAIGKTGGRAPHTCKYFCGILRNWRERGPEHLFHVDCYGCERRLTFRAPLGTIAYCSIGCLSDGPTKPTASDGGVR